MFSRPELGSDPPNGSVRGSGRDMHPWRIGVAPACVLG